MKHRRILLALLVVVFTEPAKAQVPDLDRLDDKFHHFLEIKMPGWSYKRVEPIQGSKGVLIQLWSNQNRAARITVTSLKSIEEAKQAMQTFPRNAKEAQLLAGVGDEAYVWGYQGRLLVFRRGRTVMNVEVGADVDADPDARTLTWSQRRAREAAEVKRITADFAKHLVEAIDLP